eukprot:4670740-Pyramimonas_sp.AAC.1
MAATSSWSEVVDEASPSDVAPPTPAPLQCDYPPLHEWWKVIEMATGLGDCRGQQRRPLTVVSLCSGMGTDSHTLNRCGIEHKVILSCDINGDAFDLQCASSNKAGSLLLSQPSHFVKDVHALADALEHRGSVNDEITGADFCWTTVKINELPNDGRPDLLVSGFPCQPYSDHNVNRYKQGGVTAH